MKRILEFKAFESLSGLSEDQNGWIVKCTRGIWSVGGDGKVNVKGSFDCSRQNLMDFKGVRFGRVSGNFYCYDNALTSLEGAPETVGGSFYCENNDLTTLEGAPETVGWNFYCYDNGLETLDGAPETVGGDFSCRDNSLTTLEGAPETVGGDFYCRDNALTSLEGAPQTVGRNFLSDRITIPAGRWGLSGWLEVLEEGTPEAQKMISTLISPEFLNKRLEESPEKAMVALKGVWNSPTFAKIRSELKIPKGYEDEMDLLVDLDDIGL
jgi:hypothetical protein